MNVSSPLRLMLLAGWVAFPLQAQAPPEPLASRIDHTDPARYTIRPSVHDGAGPMNYMRLENTPRVLESDLSFISRGVIPPGAGIGHHFHNSSEEMFIIFNGEAEFTINGHTSRLRGPVGAPNQLGSSHAVRNPTAQPVEWMNIAVRANGIGAGGSFDLGDPRVDVPLDPIPVFITMKLNPAQLTPHERMHGGEGTVQYRRAVQPATFRTSWAYVDHLLLPPGSSTGLHVHPEVAEFYYVMAGEGRITVGPASRASGGATETALIRYGNAVPIRFGEAHAVSNDGAEPLELMIVGIARDTRKNLDTFDIVSP